MGLLDAYRDTYFAKGTDLRNQLERITREEDLKISYYCPNIFVYINGGTQEIQVNISMCRDAYLDVSFSHCSAYDKDIFVRDFVSCFSKTKIFPAGTKYEDVNQWIEYETRSLCKQIINKNFLIKKEILNKITSGK